MKKALILLFLISLLIIMTNDSDYSKLGFDSFLRKTNPATGRPASEAPIEKTDDDLSSQSPSAKSTSDNFSVSRDGKVKLDWLNSAMTFSDGASSRVLIGNLNKSGQYGLRVLDSKGNIRFESSDGIEVISMYDATNTNELVRLDENGLTVRNGSNQTIIDSQGIVSNSDSNFYNAEVHGGINQQITSVGSYTDITGATLTTPNFSRSKRLLIYYKVIEYAYGATPGWAGDFYSPMVNIDGTEAVAGCIFSSQEGTSGDDTITQGGNFLTTLSSGVHTLKLQGQLAAGNTADWIRIRNYSLGYIVLGN